jgi:hypothetical protein
MSDVRPYASGTTQPDVHTCHAIHLIYIGASAYKYVGHETGHSGVDVDQRTVVGVIGVGRGSSGRWL